MHLSRAFSVEPRAAHTGPRAVVDWRWWMYGAAVCRRWWFLDMPKEVFTLFVRRSHTRKSLLQFAFENGKWRNIRRSLPVLSHEFVLSLLKYTNTLTDFIVIYRRFFSSDVIGCVELMRLKDGHECWEGLKPRGRGLCKSVISALACRDRVKPRRTSVGIAGSRFKPVTTPQKCVIVITIWLVISVLILNATLQTFLFGS
jgi:hypothetical protein